MSDSDWFAVVWSIQAAILCALLASVVRIELEWRRLCKEQDRIIAEIEREEEARP